MTSGSFWLPLDSATADNDSLLFSERGSAPTTPDANDWRLYFKSDGLYVVDDAGTETGPLVDSASAGSSFTGAKAYNSSTQAVNTTTAALTLDSEEFDTDAFHSTSTNTSRMTIPSGLGGYYRLSGGTFFSAGAAWVGFRLNGTTAIRGYSSASGSSYRSLSAVVNLAVGDYVELLATTNATANVGHASLPDAQTWFAVEFAGS